MSVINMYENFYQIANLITDDINSFCLQIEPVSFNHNNNSITITPISPKNFSFAYKDSNNNLETDIFFEIDKENQKILPKTISYNNKDTKTVFSENNQFDDEQIQLEIGNIFLNFTEELKNNGFFDTLNQDWRSVIYKEDSLDKNGLKYGDYIGFSKYDMRNNIFSINDIDKIDNLTDYEKNKQIVKNKILSPIYLKEEVEEKNVHPGIAFCIKKMRDSIPNTTKTLAIKKNPEIHKMYFDMLMSFQSLFEDARNYAKKEEDFHKFDFTTFMIGKIKEYEDNISKKYDFYAAIQNLLGSRKFRRLKDDILYNVTKGTSYHKNGNLYDIQQKNTNPKIEIKVKHNRETREDKFYITLSRYKSFILPVVDVEFSSYEDALDYMQNNQKHIEEKTKERTKYFDRPKITNIERKGNDYRNGRDVSPNELMETFGFRGLEYGKWNNQPKVKQEYTNYAYDAFCDLANILNIPYKSIGLNNTLAVAFGARGAGSAAAHFEPALKVINLTKMNGAGSLAHEWGHALDHHIGYNEYFSETFRSNYDPNIEDSFRRVFSLGIERFEAVETLDELNLKKNNFQKIIDNTFNHMSEHLTEKAKKQYANKTSRLKDHLYEYKNTLDDVLADTNLSVIDKRVKTSKITSSLNDFLESYSNSTNKMVDHVNRVRTYCLDLANVLERIEKNEPEYKTRPTNFTRDAVWLDKGRKKYFSKKVELFARAFETYIQKKIEDKGESSPYLVHGAKNETYSSDTIKVSPYPNKEELKNIEEKFDIFFMNLYNTPEFNNENENNLNLRN